MWGTQVFLLILITYNYNNKTNIAIQLTKAFGKQYKKQIQKGVLKPKLWVQININITLKVKLIQKIGTNYKKSITNLLSTIHIGLFKNSFQC